MISLISLRLIRIGCWAYRIEGHTREKMYYYLNEYSLRGQFKDEEDFYNSLRKNTLPVLKKIQENRENVIWKPQQLWACKVFGQTVLGSIRPKKNERNPAAYKLKQTLIKLYNADPFWREEDATVLNCKYGFDEEYNQKFSDINCFILAIQNDGNVISFEHYAYSADKLSVLLLDENKTYELENIWNEQYWDKQPVIKSWYIDKKYKVEVRANEFDYHPPHFHVSYKEYALVFRLKDGTLYRPDEKDVPGVMLSSIKEWYWKYQDELKEAWEGIHGPII